MTRRWWTMSAVLLAAATWIGSLAILLSGRWFLSCSLDDGEPLGGIDCLGTYSLPQTHSAPARAIGFLPLAVVWLAATASLVFLAVYSIRTRRRAIQPLP